MTYVSSIINNYGDIDNAKKDAETLIEIYKRQGQFIFLETISDQIGLESIGNTSEDSLFFMRMMISKLKEMILERI